MIRFLFNRYSFMVRLMEAIGLAGMCVILVLLIMGKLTPFQTILFIIIIFEYAFLRLCTFWPFYPKNTLSTQGIGLQFLKAMVPTGYILAVIFWLFVLFRQGALLFVAAALLVVILHVNIILIYLHFKDTDTAPVNSFSMTH